jgi:hypothetical protein
MFFGVLAALIAAGALSIGYSKAPPLPREHGGSTSEELAWARRRMRVVGYAALAFVLFVLINLA